MFAVMDGTFAGDGPGPRCMVPHVKNYILASGDMVAIDAVAAKMMGFDPLSIKFIRLAHERGLGCGDVREIEIVGEDISDVNFHFHVERHARQPRPEDDLLGTAASRWSICCCARCSRPGPTRLPCFITMSTGTTAWGARRVREALANRMGQAFRNLLITKQVNRNFGAALPLYNVQSCLKRSPRAPNHEILSLFFLQ